ncbi:MAG: PQQ-binding-like beta-propeller repeat protein [Thermoplasmata archaeon]|nr:MAG: PQQ-binding-like beta-propeller repeat protein [Thermoplasmata archaeon]
MRYVLSRPSVTDKRAHVRVLAILTVLMLTIPSLAVLASDGDAPAAGDDGSRAAASPDEWLTFKGDNERTGVAASEAPSVDKVLWENQYKGSVIYSSPTVWNSTVFIGISGTIKAIWMKNGTERWTYDAPNPVHSAPVIDNGVIYAGVNDYQGTGAVAVNALTGEEVWNASIPDFVSASPLVLGTSVYFGSQNGVLYCLRTSDGRERWNFTADRGILYGSIAHKDDMVYFGIEGDTDDNGKVYAINANNGREEWNQSILGSVWSSPTVAGGDVLFSSAGDKSVGITSRKGFVYAFNATDGSLSWRTDDLGMVMASPSVKNGRAYVGTFGKFINDIQIITPQMYCLDLADGHIIWNRTVSHGADNAKVWSSVTIAGAKIIFGDELGYLNVWNINGLRIWSHAISVGAAIKTTPAVAGEMIFAANTLGYVTGFGSQPDLSVNATNIEVEDEYPHLGQRVNVRAKVTNIGDKTASGRVFMYNGSLDDWHTIINFTSVLLQPGQHVWVHGVWTADEVGTRAVWVRIMDVVPNEEDESNNEALRVIEVLPPAEGWLMGRANSTGVGFIASEPPGNNLTKWLWAAGGTVSPGLVSTDDAVIAAVDTMVFALDRLQGTEDWSEAVGQPIVTPPAVGDGAVFVGSESGTVFALDLEEGTPRFQRTLDGPITSGPIVVGPMALVATSPATDTGTLWALDTFDGSTLWSRDMAAEVHAHPASWDGAVFAISDDGALLSINGSDGMLYWQYPIGNSPGTSLTAAPIVSEGLLFVASTSGFVYCLDADPGDGEDEGKPDPPGSDYDVIWTYKEQDLTPFDSSPSLVDGNLVLLFGGNGIMALDSLNGSLVWTTNVESAGTVTMDLIAVNGSLVVGGTGIHILDASSGAETWTYDSTSSPMVGGPAAVDDMLFTSDERGIVFAFGKVENQPPVARISSPAPDSQFRINQSITFDGSNSTDDKELPDTSFRWDFGDGNISLARITTHRYAEEGQYNVLLTVTDIDGESDNATVTVHVLSNHEPILDWWDVAPDSGDAMLTSFNFTVRYTDPDNDPPEFIELRLANEEGYPALSMIEVDPTDLDYTDGKMYHYITTLGSRPYPDVTFTASDGISTTSLVVQGPTVLQQRTFPNSVGDIEVSATYVGPHNLVFLPVTSPPSTFPPGLFPIGVYVELYLNTSFLKEANMTINYTFHNLEDMNISTLTIYRWLVTDTDARWVPVVDSEVDNVTGVVRAPIPSLQNDIYTVLGNRINPPPNNPPVAIIKVDDVIQSDGALVKKVYKPNEVIRFDGSESYDPDEESLNDFIALYSWSFGDGENSEGKVAQHSYKVPDRYTVTLTVRDNFGKTDTVTVDIVVREETDNNLLYFLVLLGIVVILILLFFPKGNGSKPTAQKKEPKEPAPKAEPNGAEEEAEEPEDDDEDAGTSELDDIIDELEEDRGA